MSRAFSLLIGLLFVAGLTACGSEVVTTSAPSGESPTASGPAALIPACDPETADHSGDLTGVWEANDDGTYYVRETRAGCVWWYGSDCVLPAGERRPHCFSNVAVGQVEGDQIQLNWSDVPYGDFLNGGTLTLQISADGNTFTKKAATGGFGGSTWTRKAVSPSPS